MALVVRILIVVAVIAVAFLLFRPRPVVVVVIQDGKARRLHGKVPPHFIEDCDLIARDFAVREGAIRGFQRDGRISLRFSREISAAHHQRFRNAWNIPRGL